MAHGNTITVEGNGKELTITVDELIECQHCGYIWQSQSEATRPTCPDCQRKTDRESHGYHYSLITRYDALAGSNEPIEFTKAHARLDKIKEKLKIFEDAGWTIDTHGGQGSFFLSSPNAPPHNVAE